MKTSVLAGLAAIALAASASAASAQALKGGGPEGAEAGDRLTVLMVVINRTRMPTPKMAFQVRVDCRPTGSTAVVILRAPDRLSQSVAVRPGSVCVATALAPPPPPEPCRWVVSYPDGRRARAGRTVRVVNELWCDFTGDGPWGAGGYGYLRVVKEIVNETGLPTPAVGFRVQVDCRPGPITTLVLAAGSGLSRTIMVPAGGQCAIRELTPPAPPEPCGWATSYVPASRMGPAGSTLRVRNTLVCPSAP